MCNKEYAERKLSSSFKELYCVFLQRKKSLHEKSFINYEASANEFSSPTFSSSF